MITNCANPKCGVPFRYFRDGKLFVIDRNTHSADSHSCAFDTSSNTDLQHYWLCGTCCKTMSIVVGLDNEISVVENADSVA